jgi:hypothetical protein
MIRPSSRGIPFGLGLLDHNGAPRRFHLAFHLGVMCVHSSVPSVDAQQVDSQTSEETTQPAQPTGQREGGGSSGRRVQAR